MAGILEILSQSGALPLEELKVRTVGSAEDVERRVALLTDQGIVKVSKDPDLITKEALGDDRILTLTSKGFRSTF